MYTWYEDHFVSYVKKNFVSQKPDLYKGDPHGKPGFLQFLTNEIFFRKRAKRILISTIYEEIFILSLLEDV